ncbi:MAG: carboxypeptidase regulatory-like domain-containing protein [Actinomycetota bacterium]|nr:carboxypeptidase regulatory-like domain-containing protein [Actinomycetota bacterium]
MRMRTLVKVGLAAVLAMGPVVLTSVAPAGATGEPLSGVVTDSTGNPLEGVYVSLLGAGASGTFTDAAGNYAMWPADGTYQLTFSKPGYRGEIYDELVYPAMGLPPTGAPVTISTGSPLTIDESLMRLPQLTGTVVDRQGNPVAASVSGANVFPGQPNGGGTVATGGNFTLEVPQSGTYRVSGFAGGFLSTWAPSTLDVNAAQSWAVGYDQTVDIGQLTLLRGGSISGTVTSSNGPIVGAQVTANPNPPLPFGVLGVSGFATTAIDGTYTISGLPEASYQVNFSASGYLGEVYDNFPVNGFNRTAVAVVEGQAAANADAQLGAAAIVTGHVTDHLGNPLPGATVQAYLQGGSGLSTTNTITNFNGDYTITGLANGAYVISASSAGLAQGFISGASIPSPADVLNLAGGTTTTANLTLQPLGAITGRVLQPDGQPLAGSWVSVLAITAPGVQFFAASFASYSTGTTTDANGYYTFPALAPVTFRVSAGAATQNDPLTWEYYLDQYSEATATPVVVPAGGTATNIDFQLEVGGVISGRITDPAGNPIVGTYVSASGPNGENGGATLTDANGEYTMRGITPGSFTVQASPIGDYPQTFHPSTTSFAEATLVSVGLGEVRTGIDIQMQAAARIEATVLDPSGNPIPVSGSGYAFWGLGFCVDPAVPVAALPPCTDGTFGASPANSAKPSDGHWVGTGIASDTYNVAAFAGFPMATSASTQLTLGAGDVATCTFQINGPASCTVTHSPTEPDADGVPATTEDGVAPGGDGNGDAVPDSQQSNVTSLPSPVPGGGYVTVAAPAGLELSSVTVVDPATIGATPPPGATVDNGVIAYTVSGVTPGATVDIDVYLTTPTTATGYAKVQAGQWVPLPGAAFTKVNDSHFVLHLTDGGNGDEDGQANGVVVDPGAPISLDTTAPTITCPAAPTFVLNATGAVVTAQVADAGAGVASSTAGAAAVTTAIGNGTATITATDLAGNSASVPCAYLVGVRITRFAIGEDDDDDHGDGHGAARIEAGETVKVSWRTVDAKGKPVAVPANAALRTAATTCASDPVVTGPDTAANLTNQGVKYKGNGYWEAKWRTDKAWRGCRQLTVVVLGDSETEQFRFVRG